jgi:hypothetical protein
LLRFKRARSENWLHVQLCVGNIPLGMLQKASEGQ